MKLKNVTLCLEPQTTLFKEEADAIIAVVLNVLKHDGRLPKAGTFLLYGVEDGKQDVQKIISFSFKNGAVRNCLESSCDSDELGDTILKRVAAHMSHRTAITYYVDSPTFLELKTTYGRFLCFYYDESMCNQTYIYCAVAKALASMGKEDEVLQEACEYLFAVEMEDHTRIDVLAGYVDGLFTSCELPELKIWKEWHEPANNAGELTLFFQ